MVNNTTNQNQLIQEQVANFVVEPLQAASVILNSGATIIDSAAPVKIPRIVSTSGVGFVGEGEKIPDNYTVEASELRLMPEERKSLKVISRVTNELIRSAAVGVSQMLQARIVEDMRVELDEALLTGDGADDGPTGLFEQPGVTTGTLDLTEPDTFLDGIALAAAQDVTPDRWIMNAQDFIEVRKIKDGDGRYILQPDMTQAGQFQLQGIPVSVSNRVPRGKAALLNIGELIVVRDTDPQITILNELFAQYDQTGIRVTSRYDLGLARPSGVVILEQDAE